MDLLDKFETILQKLEDENIKYIFWAILIVIYYQIIFCPTKIT